MKIVCVVDSINNIRNKVNMLKNRFGDDIIFIVKAQLADLFSTFGYNTSAIYNTNLTKIIHFTLQRTSIEDTVIFYTSVEITEELLDKFVTKIGNRNKLVNVVPTYNTMDKMWNGLYNIYIKGMFKVKDGLASPKLQFLPKAMVEELLSSHFGNRMFEIDPRLVSTLEVEDKKANKSLKIKPKFNRFHLLTIIVALMITALLLTAIAFNGTKFFVIALFVMLYLLDIIITFILQCKQHFDNRFLK
ncbi:MAG: hypothetical protein E7374_04175 [Clostridiales bacterium]|nr:hypothetical protein [Clostridiales bacterium]